MGVGSLLPLSRGIGSTRGARFQEVGSARSQAGLSISRACGPFPSFRLLSADPRVFFEDGVWWWWFLGCGVMLGVRAVRGAPERGS